MVLITDDLAFRFLTWMMMTLTSYWQFDIASCTGSALPLEHGILDRPLLVMHFLSLIFGHLLGIVVELA